MNRAAAITAIDLAIIAEQRRCQLKGSGLTAVAPKTCHPDAEWSEAEGPVFAFSSWATPGRLLFIFMIPDGLDSMSACCENRELVGKEAKMLLFEQGTV